MLLALVLLLGIRAKEHNVFGTIDVNLAELEYLAGHLDPVDCRRLVAALHYTTYELPESIEGAERKIDQDIPCLRQLLHWNGSPGEGRGQTHEDIEHRLRQLNLNELADWLGKTTFEQLGKDLDRSMKQPFGELGEQETETVYPVTMEALEEPGEEDPWLPVDTILMASLGVLSAALFTLIVALIIHQARLRHYGENKYDPLAREDGDGGKETNERKSERKRTKKKGRKQRKKEAARRITRVCDETETIRVDDSDMERGDTDERTDRENDTRDNGTKCWSCCNVQNKK